MKNALLHESKLNVLGAVFYFVKREWDPAAICTTPVIQMTYSIAFHHILIAHYLYQYPEINHNRLSDSSPVEDVRVRSVPRCRLRSASWTHDAARFRDSSLEKCSRLFMTFHWGYIHNNRIYVRTEIEFTLTLIISRITATDGPWTVVGIPPLESISFDFTMLITDTISKKSGLLTVLTI